MTHTNVLVNNRFFSLIICSCCLIRARNRDKRMERGESTQTWHCWMMWGESWLDNSTSELVYSVPNKVAGIQFLFTVIFIFLQGSFLSLSNPPCKSMCCVENIHSPARYKAYLPFLETVVRLNSERSTSTRFCFTKAFFERLEDVRSNSMLG